ncbi:MAG TPA: gliding motility-associated C-terminal domain-containing protein [Saprospiraceae bacterium]|nr:gliding motility-associated C-terminal domain-containing protein [Saprospiraceae bacterium]HMQ83779.1 gliding motility-associated C-terminal domain-containing protein [Saprospiraceae bacterium]
MSNSTFALALFCLALWVQNQASFAQNCDQFSLDAGADVSVCQPGSNVPLSAQFNGLPLSVSWSPGTGISNPSSLSTTATVTATTTYTVTVRIISDENLIANGTFALGDTGFFTDYVPGTGGSAGLLTNEGQYAIADNAGDTHNQFADCDDHTGNGNMMVVNGSGNPDNVWCQNVAVEPNTDYDFSAWVTSVVSQNPANLQFSINGFLLGNVFNASSTPCVWQEFSELWSSGNVTNATICVVNVNEDPAGNDFALDDISFRPVCEYTDDITITVGSPLANPVVNCEATTNSLLFTWDAVPDAAGYEVQVITGPLGTMTSSTSYLIEGLNPEQAVTIQVTALNSADNCPDGVALVSCQTEACPAVFLTINGPEQICEGEEATFSLEVFSTSTGPFSATVSDGTFPFTIDNISTGTFNFSIPLIQSAQVEIISFTDQANPGCVFTNLPNWNTQVLPALNAGIADTLATCDLPGNQIDLTQLLSNPDAGGNWSFASGNNAPGAAFDPNTATLILGDLLDGFYGFEYRLSSPGCQDAVAMVGVDVLTTPIADAGEDQNIGCSLDAAVLGGTNSSTGNEYDLVWTPLEGGLLSDPNVPNPATEQAGLYVLTITHETTACVAIDSVRVIDLISMPAPELQVTNPACFDAKGGQIEVISVTDGEAPYQYSLDGVNFQDSPVFADLSADIFTVTVIDALQCTGEATAIILPAVEFSIQLQAANGQASPELRLGDSIQLELLIIGDPAIASIAWEPQPEGCNGCSSTFVQPDETTTYEVIVLDSTGCEATASLTVRIDDAFRVFVPNAFSPNDDGRNDLFFPYLGSEFSRINYWYIMDRWGGMVYSQTNVTPNDTSMGWDGSIRGKLAPTGVYTYVMELELINGQRIIQEGEVHLLR